MSEDTYEQHYNCKNGEINCITKEVFCNRYMEFCKFVNCNLKGGQDESK